LRVKQTVELLEVPIVAVGAKFGVFRIDFARTYRVHGELIEAVYVVGPGRHSATVQTAIGKPMIAEPIAAKFELDLCTS